MPLPRGDVGRRARPLRQYPPASCRSCSSRAPSRVLRELAPGPEKSPYRPCGRLEHPETSVLRGTIGAGPIEATTEGIPAAVQAWCPTRSRRHAQGPQGCTRSNPVDRRVPRTGPGAAFPPPPPLFCSHPGWFRAESVQDSTVVPRWTGRSWSPRCEQLVSLAR